jgi:outer membrane immunogenic protein
MPPLFPSFDVLSRRWRRAMKNFAIIGLAFAALIAPAMAADVVPPNYRAPRSVIPWSGCYIGAHVGAGWSSQDVSNVAGPGIDQAGVVGTINGAGAVGGGYAGCNLQWSPAWVIGVEGDFSGMHLGGTVDAANIFLSGEPAATGGVAWTGHLDSIATLRGRLGYAWGPNLLLFVTGGGAWGWSSYSSIDAFVGGCPACGATSFSNTNAGYVVGGGVDWAPWNNNWIVRLEYLYYDLGGAAATATFQSPLTGVAANPRWKDLVVQTARIGLSYKF